MGSLGLFMKTGIWILTLLALTVLPTQARLFKNQSGKEIEASIVAAPGENVTLMRADGKKFTFPMKTLSEVDQKFVAAWKKSEPGYQSRLFLQEEPKKPDQEWRKNRRAMDLRNRDIE